MNGLDSPDIANLRVGDTVQFWDNRRADGAVGGWAQFWWHGKVLKVNRKTAQVFVNVRKRAEIVPLDRIEIIWRQR